MNKELCFISSRPQFAAYVSLFVRLYQSESPVGKMFKCIAFEFFNLSGKCIRIIMVNLIQIFYSFCDQFMIFLSIRQDPKDRGLKLKCR